MDNVLIGRHIMCTGRTTYLSVDKMDDSSFEKCQLECEGPIGNMVMIMYSVPLNCEVVLCGV